MRVKLGSHGVADMWPSLSFGMGEAAIEVGFGMERSIESKRSDDGEDEPAQGRVLDAPQRGETGRVEQVLRGKILVS